MSIKEDINSIKKDIGAEEQFLEGLIKSERFVNKYKKPLIFIATLLILGAIGYASYIKIQENRLLKSNEIFAKLTKNTNDKALQEELKNLNPTLHEVFLFSQIVKNDDKNMQENFIKNSKNDILKDIISYQNNKNSSILQDLQNLMSGYELLKKGKKEEAMQKFSFISFSSPLQNIVKNLKHYVGK